MFLGTNCYIVFRCVYITPLCWVWKGWSHSLLSGFSNEQNIPEIQDLFYEEKTPEIPCFFKKHQWPVEQTIIWSNYSDLTRPHPKWWFSKGNPLISGKSRLVKYYNLARIIPIDRFSALFSYGHRPTLPKVLVAQGGRFLPWWWGVDGYMGRGVA